MEWEQEVPGVPGGGGGPRCRHQSSQSSSAPASSSRVLALLQLLLAALLTGQVSCYHTSTTSRSLSSTTTGAPSSAAYYVVTVSVAANGRTNVSEITTWLTQVFQSDLESCVPPDHPSPTAAPAWPTTPASTFQPTSAVTVTSSYYTSAATTRPGLNASTSMRTLSNSTSSSSSAPAAATTTGRSRTTTAATLTSGTSSSNPTGLFQGMEVACENTTETKMSCVIMLKLSESVPSCCILQTLCEADTNSSDIQVVGNRADRTSPLQPECNAEEESSCIYDHAAGLSCNDAAFVEYHSNSSHCGAGSKKSNCSCSAYCNGTDAYYTFQLWLRDADVDILHVLSQFSQSPQALNCTQFSRDTCDLVMSLSQSKGVGASCVRTSTHLQSCTVVLKLAGQLPTHDVWAAVAEVLRPHGELVDFDGEVARMATCGNQSGGEPLDEASAWCGVDLAPGTFCTTAQQHDIISCQNGKSAALPLEGFCTAHQFSTEGPNVAATTVIQPNTTTAVVTSPPLITTTGPLDATSSPINTTSTSPSTSTSTSLSTSTSTPSGAPVSTAASSTASVTHGAAATTSGEATTTASAESRANALLDLARNVSSLNASQISQLVSELEGLLSGPNVSLSLGNISVQIVSSLLGASPEVLSPSSNRIIGVVDTVGMKLVVDEQPEALLSTSLALCVKPADGANFQETTFTIADPNTVEVRGDRRRRRSSRRDSSVPQGFVRLPASLTQNLTSEQQQLASRVQFNFYQSSSVFQDASMGERRLNSGILGASVANLSIAGLQENVEIVLRNMEPVPANFVASCVFWDFTMNNGSGGWNSNGCIVRNSTASETLCSCNHLTSFAILLDISRQPITSRVQATILTFITYIGCGVSAIFLSVTLLTYLSFGKLRKDIPSKILIQLCTALLLLNLVFLVDAWLALYPDALGLCISTAWFLHYFLLVVFTWMGLEAVHMYLALVKVFNSYVSRYMLKFSLVGWGVPMLVVIVVIAIDKDNYGLVSYGRFADGTSDDFCWLKNDVAFYVAVVAYFCVIFAFNLIMFVVVLVQLCRIKRQNPHNSTHRTTMQDVRSVSGITILLGLTWGFAFFAWGPVNLPFMYLFAIFNSLQGFFIFVFHCAAKENVRRQWRTYLCCGTMRLAENSEWSRTATQKTAKKSSVTRLTSLQSSESSNSNQSATFLFSDASEHSHGISNPFDDRTITADEDNRMDVILNEVNSQRRNH